MTSVVWGRSTLLRPPKSADGAEQFHASSADASRLPGAVPFCFILMGSALPGGPFPIHHSLFFGSLRHPAPPPSLPSGSHPHPKPKPPRLASWPDIWDWIITTLNKLFVFSASEHFHGNVLQAEHPASVSVTLGAATDHTPSAGSPEQAPAYSSWCSRFHCLPLGTALDLVGFSLPLLFSWHYSHTQGHLQMLPHKHPAALVTVSSDQF